MGYGSGRWLHFALLLPAQVGVVLLFSLYGLPLMLRDLTRTIILANYLAYFLLHTVIYHFGLFASGGYIEFLLPMAPIFAISGVLGFDWLCRIVTTACVRRVRWGPPWDRTIFAHALALVAVAAVVASGLKASAPVMRSEEALASAEAAAWLRAHGLDRARIEARNVYVFYDLSLPMPRPGKSRTIQWISPADMPPGSIAIWDKKYSDAWDLKRADLENERGDWELLKAFGPHDEVVVFRKRFPSRPPQREAR
jgi:hypothetical protein